MLAEDERLYNEQKASELERQQKVIDAIKSGSHYVTYFDMEFTVVKRAYHRYLVELEARVQELERAGRRGL
jgi:hypothetical protein